MVSMYRELGTQEEPRDDRSQETISANGQHSLSRRPGSPASIYPCMVRKALDIRKWTCREDVFRAYKRQTAPR